MKLPIRIQADRLAVCRLEPGAPLPAWVAGAFTSVTRTREELSIVCDAAVVPADVQATRDWRVLKVEGPIPFEVTGVAAALVSPLAGAGISVFLLATYDTDYLLVREGVFERTVAILRESGHDVS
jgi:hypothetical protein